MEKKNLRATGGLPFNFGIAAGIFLLLATALSLNLTQAFMQNMAAQYGLPASVGTFSIVSSVVAFLVSPGIFLILLILAKNQPKRGTTFCVVWIIIAAVSILSGIFSAFSTNAMARQMKQYAETLMPGGMMIAQVLSILGNVCIILSCVFLLQRFRPKIPQPVKTPDDGDSDNNNNTPPAA